ncbi:MAG: hypothetical protein ACRET1_00595, partial [Burkholderiales bacterium]
VLLIRSAIERPARLPATPYDAVAATKLEDVRTILSIHEWFDKENLSHKYSRDALWPKRGGCKARRAAHSRSMGKRRNAADALLGHNPSGLGRVSASLTACIGWLCGVARSSNRIPNRRGRTREYLRDRFLMNI